MEYDFTHHCMISADYKGHLEYWNGSISTASSAPTDHVHPSPTSHILTEYDTTTTTTTDNYSSSHDAEQQQVNTIRDRRVRVFDSRTSRIRVQYDKQTKVYNGLVVMVTCLTNEYVILFTNSNL